MRLSRLGLSFLLVAGAACGSSNPTGPGTTLVNGSFTAKVDGSNFSATSAIVTVTGNIIGIGAGNAAGQSMGFAWVDAGPGTYAISNISPTNGTFIAGGAGWVAGVTGGSGTITITTRTASRVVGQFNFVMIPSSGGATGNKTITQGNFDLTF